MNGAPTAFAPIRKRTLAETIHDRLLESIIIGELPAGSRLNLDEISSSFAVSRTPVREALARLEQQQFVEVSRNSATTVAPWTVDDMQVRVRLLASVARIAAEDPTHSLPTLPEDATSGPSFFVSSCHAFARTLSNPLARQTAATLAAPLELFLQPSVLQAHRINADAIRTGPAAAFLTETIESANRRLIGTAIDDLAEALIRGLSTNTPAPDSGSRSIRAVD